MKFSVRNLTRLIAFILLFSTLMMLVACKDKATVYGHCELTIDLPDNYVEYDSSDVYDVAYTDGVVIVGILRLSYEACATEGIPTMMSPELFAEYYRTLALSGIDATETKQVGDVPYYTYSQSSLGGESFTYMPTFYFSPYAYFVLTYILPTDQLGFMQESLLGYATTVKLTGIP